MATKHASPARPRRAQLNIRSDYARDRAAQLARDTGKSVTEVVEEALRAFAPTRPPAPDGMQWAGDLLIFKPTGRVITAEQAQAALEMDRERDAWGNAFGDVDDAA